MNEESIPGRPWLRHVTATVKTGCPSLGRKGKTELAPSALIPFPLSSRRARRQSSSRSPHSSVVSSFDSRYLANLAQLSTPSTTTVCPLFSLIIPSPALCSALLPLFLQVAFPCLSVVRHIDHDEGSSRQHRRVYVPSRGWRQACILQLQLPRPRLRCRGGRGGGGPGAGRLV